MKEVQFLYLCIICFKMHSTEVVHCYVLFILAQLSINYRRQENEIYVSFLWGKRKLNNSGILVCQRYYSNQTKFKDHTRLNKISLFSDS